MTHRRVPKYRRYKPKDLGLVVIDGKQHYLGRYGTPESLAEYNRLVQEWLVRWPIAPAYLGADNVALTVDDLLLAFWTRHAEPHYRRPDGTATGELANYRDSLRPIRRLYGPTPASDFSPLKLKSVRRSMIESGLARDHQPAGRQDRPPLQMGRLRGTGPRRRLPRDQDRRRAPQGPDGGPGDRADPARLGRVRRGDPAPRLWQVWAMIELQPLTGMRPGEVVIMRTCDLDRSREFWEFTPSGHKTAHHGRERRIYLGPRAQEVVGP